MSELPVIIIIDDENGAANDERRVLCENLNIQDITGDDTDIEGKSLATNIVTPVCYAFFSTGQSNEGKNSVEVVNNFIFKHISNNEVSLILLDSEFKEKDENGKIIRRKKPLFWGKEIYETVKSTFPKIPVKIFSSHEGDFAKPKNSGATYIRKSPDTDLRKELFKNAQLTVPQKKKLAYWLKLPPEEKVIIKSSKMLDLYNDLSLVAKSNVSVYLLGESGTGKEGLAKYIHDCSERPEDKFFPLNCAALADNLLESELFGHEKGAFTGADKVKCGLFERANGGTIFLDEIGDMPENMQDKILRVLQEKKFRKMGGTKESYSDFRLVTASHKNLEEMQLKGNFRSDLYFRLVQYTVKVPPLRKRTEEIPFFIEHFTQKVKEDIGLKEVKGFNQDALKFLSGYDFPGNLRELETIVRACVMANFNQAANDSIDTQVVSDVLASIYRQDISNSVSKERINADKPEDLHISQTLTDLLSNVEGYNPKYHEVIGSYERIRSVFQQLILKSMVEIRKVDNNIAESFTKNLPGEEHWIYTDNPAFLDRMMTLGLSSNSNDPKVHEIINSLVNSAEFSALLAERKSLKKKAKK